MGLKYFGLRPSERRKGKDTRDRILGIVPFGTCGFLVPGSEQYLGSDRSEGCSLGSACEQRSVFSPLQNDSWRRPGRTEQLYECGPARRKRASRAYRGKNCVAVRSALPRLSLQPITLKGPATQATQENVVEDPLAPLRLPALAQISDFWQRYDRLADIHDKKMTSNLNGNLDVLLIFVGLSQCPVSITTMTSDVVLVPRPLCSPASIPHSSPSPCQTFLQTPQMKQILSFDCLS